jgi:hypothetical protein
LKVWEEQEADRNAAETAPVPPSPLTDDMDLGSDDLEEIFEDRPSPPAAAPANASVSQSEIDDLFDRIHEDGGEKDEKK